LMIRKARIRKVSSANTIQSVTAADQTQLDAVITPLARSLLSRCLSLRGVPSVPLLQLPDSHIIKLSDSHFIKLFSSPRSLAILALAIDICA
jgi:hypothetical protein